MRNRTLLLIWICGAWAASAQPRRTLSLDDLAKFKDVRDAQCSPDGKMVAYDLSQIDVKNDRPGNSHIWMIGYDGSGNRQVTSSEQSENSPRWSPDGKYLAFTSTRPGPARGNQIWLLPLSGGEALQLTDVKGRIQGYEWSPDGKRIAIVIGDPDPNNPDPDANDAPANGGRGGRGPAPKPIVIDRYHFKQDVQGYLLSGRHSFIYLFDLATKKAERLTTQSKWDESAPSWSQDGKWLVFMAGEDKKWGAYSQEHIAIVPADGSAAPTLVKAALDMDRGFNSPRWTSDGKAIIAYVTDDRSHYPVRIPLSGGAAEPLMSKPVVVNFSSSAGACTVVTSGSDTQHAEIYALDHWRLRQLTHANDEVMAELELGKTEEVSFKAADGNEVHGLLTYPVGYQPGTKVPLLLRIHGGPKGQDAHGFSFETQFFAAHGYAVLRMNYRGSDGRGSKYQKAIAADWGDLEVKDLEAGVNGAIAMGVADPERLGVGGWSYGGILTDYMIASDPRFKAATSGAGTAFTVSFYGTDQYIIQYDNEIGPPWTKQGWDTYVKISYPFLHADRIKTPTIFFGGEQDFNVPVQGGQQMYQALRSLGVDTQLIIYPGEHHGITRPSFVRDRYERYLAWYDKYLMHKNTTPASTSARER